MPKKETKNSKQGSLFLKQVPMARPQRFGLHKKPAIANAFSRLQREEIFLNRELDAHARMLGGLKKLPKIHADNIRKTRLEMFGKGLEILESRWKQRNLLLRNKEELGLGAKQIKKLKRERDTLRRQFNHFHEERERLRKKTRKKSGKKQ